MPTILDKIVAAKRVEVASARTACPELELRARLRDAPPARDFFAALSKPGPIRLIAEIKKASPSKGIIRDDFQPLEIARQYEENGAACLSVLTDVQFFQGGIDILSAVRRTVELPVLRKDFILDPYQILEARVAGADAVLLIAECLSGDELRRLHDTIVELQMTPLVELYEPDNLPRVLQAGARLVGINNRDLRTFETDLQHTIRMKQRIPSDRLVVGESGIHSREDALLLEKAGVDAILVGEHLMAAADVGQAVRQLLGRSQPAAD